MIAYVSNILNAIGKRIRNIRKENLISQEKLASKAGLDRTYIGAIERGQRNVSILSLEKIAKALGTSISNFFKD